MARQNILFVGGGLTAAVTCSLISRDPVLSEKLNLVVWEKARGVGGRMATSRSPKDPENIADLGAQFVTVSPSYGRKHGQFYKEMLSAGILEPFKSKVEGMKQLPEGTEHYIAPQGMNSVVKKFLRDAEEKIGVETRFGAHVSSLGLNSGKNWQVSTLDGSSSPFDVVVLTMPVPQILELQGDVSKILENRGIKERLSKVRYSSRFCLGLFFDREAKLPEYAWSAKFIYDNPIWRYASLESRKLNRAPDPTALVLHSNIDFGAENVERTKESMEPSLLKSAQELFPELPEPSSVKCHKWRFSQVLDSYPESNGFEIGSENPILLLSGDGFTHSHVDGCIESATKSVEYLRTRMA